jgi:hypothetical protein
MKISSFDKFGREMDELESNRDRPDPEVVSVSIYDLGRTGDDALGGGVAAEGGRDGQPEEDRGQGPAANPPLKAYRAHTRATAS